MQSLSLYCLVLEWECPQADLFVLLDVGVRMSPGSLFVLLGGGMKMSPCRINKKGVNLSSKDVAQTQHKLRNILWWSLCPLCLLACQMRVTCHTNTTQAPQHPQVEFMYIAFTCMPGESYCRRLRSLFLCLCDVFWVLINSLACWLCTGARGFVLFQIVFWGKLSRQQTVHASEVFKQMQIQRKLKEREGDGPSRTNKQIQKHTHTHTHTQHTHTTHTHTHTQHTHTHTHKHTNTHTSHSLSLFLSIIIRNYHLQDQHLHNFFQHCEKLEAGPTLTDDMNCVNKIKVGHSPQWTFPPASTSTCVAIRVTVAVTGL